MFMLMRGSESAAPNLSASKVKGASICEESITFLSFN